MTNRTVCEFPPELRERICAWAKTFDLSRSCEQKGVGLLSEVDVWLTSQPEAPTDAAPRSLVERAKAWIAHHDHGNQETVPYPVAILRDLANATPTEETAPVSDEWDEAIEAAHNAIVVEPSDLRTGSREGVVEYYLSRSRIHAVILKLKRGAK